MEKIFLEAGMIVNVHGLIGYIKVIPWIDDMYSFEDFEYVFIDNKKYDVQNIKFQKQSVLLKLKDVDSIDSAQALKNKIILCERDQINLKEGRYFIVDLLESVVLKEDKSIVGILKDIIPTGSNDVYEVLTPENKKIYIPAISDVVCSVNTKDKIIIVKQMDGLEF